MIQEQSHAEVRQGQPTNKTGAAAHHPHLLPCRSSITARIHIASGEMLSLKPPKPRSIVCGAGGATTVLPRLRDNFRTTTIERSIK